MNETIMVEFLRWFMAALLGLMGAMTLLAPRQLAAVCPHVPTRGLASADAERVGAAGCRRKQLENISPWIGVAVGLAWLGFAAACALGAATPSLWYAAAFLALALGMSAAYLRLRAVAGKRVAVLSARSPIGVVPWYWFAGAAAVAVTTLVARELRGFDYAALLVCAAALASTWLAWRVAAMPALMSGDDVSADRYVDEHLRFGRATGILLFAYVETFVFVMFDTSDGVTWLAHPLTAALAAFAWLAFSAWTIARKLRPQRVALS